MNNSIKNIKGITLISLIVTIVILIILASVVMSLSIGENNIFKRALLAKELYMNGQIEEQTNLNTIDSNFDYSIGSKDIFEELLKLCKIDKNYKIEDLSINKDGILTKLLENTTAIDIIANNENIFLDILTNSETSILELVGNENFKQAIISKEKWIKNIIEKGSNIPGFDEKCDTIPKMTSATSEEGQIIVSGCDNSHPEINAFDKNLSTFWYHGTQHSEPTEKPYIIYKYSTNHNIYKIYIEHSNITNGVATETFELYISEEEQGDDSWVKVYEDSFSYGRNTAGTPKNITCTLDKITSVKRIKINSLTHCTSDNWWDSGAIHEIQAYGI